MSQVQVIYRKRRRLRVWLEESQPPDVNEFSEEGRYSALDRRSRRE